MTETTIIEKMLSRTMTAVEKVRRDVLRFTADDGDVFEFYHEQDCCENVAIEDIVGDLGDLVGHPLLVAEFTESGERDEYGDSTTWTFYRFATVEGTVTVRWCGTSNGFYSESVDFRHIPAKGKVG